MSRHQPEWYRPGGSIYGNRPPVNKIKSVPCNIVFILPMWPCRLIGAVMPDDPTVVRSRLVLITWVCLIAGMFLIGLPIGASEPLRGEPVPEEPRSET